MNMKVAFWIEVLLVFCALALTYYSLTQEWWFTAVVGIGITCLLAWFAWDIDSRM